MVERNRVPSIRFKGFTGDWEQRKLSELIIEYKETVDSDCILPVLTSSKTEGVVLQEDHFGRKQQHDITGYNILPRNYCTYRNRSDGVDFTFNINKCCSKGIISKFYPVFYGNASDIFFISLVLNNSNEVVKEIGYTCTGTGQKVLSFLDLLKMKIRVPSYDEQRKVSSCFEQIDNLITFHQRKYDKLLNVKKAMLKKMFPKEGEKVPEIRFKGFIDDWEQNKLIDVTDRIIVGLATSVTPYYRDSGVPLLRNMNIKENHLDDSDILYLDEKYAKANESKMIHANDVLTVHTGSNIGLTCITPEKYEGCLSFTTLITTPNKNTLDSLFLMQYMNSTLGKKKIEAIITAGGKPNLNSGDLEKFEVVHPNIDEQHEVGKFFQNLDNLIVLQKHKVEKLKNIKIAMLKKMFV